MTITQCSRARLPSTVFTECSAAFTVNQLPITNDQLPLITDN
ncbi:hypothetical protein [Chroococcidiopsis cubana]|nr:hypothetical protein [Chroococcidiopsis cubana]